MNGLLKLALRGLLDAGGGGGGGGSLLSQMWVSKSDISISFPQSEHLMVGRKLAGLTPSAASAAASDMAAVREACRREWVVS